MDVINILQLDFNEKIEFTDHSPSVDQQQGQYTFGVYKVQTREGITPGKYRVDVEPVGKNITMHIKDGTHDYTEHFNGSISFEIDIDSTIVFISVTIYDPISYQNWTRDQVFEVEMERVDGGDDHYLIPLWSLTLIGGVYVAVQAAYRRERE